MQALKLIQTDLLETGLLKQTSFYQTVCKSQHKYSAMSCQGQVKVK